MHFSHYTSTFRMTSAKMFSQRLYRIPSRCVQGMSTCISLSSTSNCDMIAKKLPLWSIQRGERDTLKRIIIFPDFISAWGFMSQIALHAEKMNHHPGMSMVVLDMHTCMVRYDRYRVVRTPIQSGSMFTIASRLL